MPASSRSWAGRIKIQMNRTCHARSMCSGIASSFMMRACAYRSAPESSPSASKVPRHTSRWGDPSTTANATPRRLSTSSASRRWRKTAQTFVLADDTLDRERAYTGLSRGAERNSLYVIDPSDDRADERHAPPPTTPLPAPAEPSHKCGLNPWPSTTRRSQRAVLGSTCRAGCRLTTRLGFADPALRGGRSSLCARTRERGARRSGNLEAIWLAG
jgi:hypothetical protein